MVRIILVKAIILMSATVWANPQKANTDLAWSDVGDNIFQEKEDKRVQRDYDSIGKNEGLMPVGSFVRLAQDVNLRTAPGGTVIKPALKGEDFQVLEVIVDEKGKRFYKVKSGANFGYIYAGTKVSYAKWARQTWSSDNKVIAEPGDLVKVKRKRGLKILKTIKDEKSFTSIPKNSQVQVESVVQDNKGKLFYKVKYKSKSGFAEVVDTKEIATIKNWEKIY
jgi:hypothetical protein